MLAAYGLGEEFAADWPGYEAQEPEGFRPSWAQIWCVFYEPLKHVQRLSLRHAPRYLF